MPLTQLDQIRAAQALIEGRVHRTPLLTSRSLQIEEQGDAFLLQPERIGVTEEMQFCFIAVSHT